MRRSQYRGRSIATLFYNGVSRHGDECSCRICVDLRIENLKESKQEKPQ